MRQEVTDVYIYTHAYIHRAHESAYNHTLHTNEKKIYIIYKYHRLNREGEKKII